MTLKTRLTSRFPNAKRERTPEDPRRGERNRAEGRDGQRKVRVVVVLERTPDAWQLAPVVRRLVERGHVVKVLTAGGEVPATVVQAMAPSGHATKREGVRCEPLADEPRSIEDHLDGERPDAVVVCPALSETPPIAWCLEAARRRAIPTLGLPATWEELARAAVAPGLPDLILAWNQPLADAARARGVPGEHLMVTGAPHLDRYCRWGPNRHREFFCAEVGLDHRRPFVAYLMGVRDEMDRVILLAGALRDHPATRHLQMLVRPPPGDGEGSGDWLAAEATLWRPAKTVIDRRKLEQELFTGLSYAAAAVGATASSLVVAGIAATPCILLTGEIADGIGTEGLDQRVPAAFAQPASGIEQAVARIEAALAGDEPKRTERQYLVAHLIRPHGATRPVVPAVALVIEAAALEGVAGARANSEPAGGDQSATARRSAAVRRTAGEAPTTAGRQAGGRDRGLGSQSPELAQIMRTRLAHRVEIGQPLVLISQIQRSGGTLLNELIDSHPQCHVHPPELKIGYPQSNETWPQLDPSGDPEQWFEMLRERRMERYFSTGYARSPHHEPHPFLLVPSLQRELFRRGVTEHPIASPRDILDLYMTSYFNAWLDNHNLLGDDKRWVVSFGNRLGVATDSREHFFRDYPDGRLISIVREPRSWFASARRWRPEAFGDLERSLRLWSWSTHAMVEARERHGDRVLIVEFESLLQDVERTMGLIARFLGISYLPELCRPTFNGLPTQPNSSFSLSRYGLAAQPMSRADQLDPDTFDYIDRHASELYSRVAALAC